MSESILLLPPQRTYDDEARRLSQLSAVQKIVVWRLEQIGESAQQPLN